MDSSLIEEKFTLFFNQFKTDQDIRFLFEFLEIMVTQYKANPVQVVEYLKEQNIAIENNNNNSNAQSVPNQISPLPIAVNIVKSEPIVEEATKGPVVEVEFLSSSDESEFIKRIKNEPSESFNDSLKRENAFTDTGEEKSKRKVIKKESEDQNLINESIRTISNNKPQSLLDISIKEEWLNLYYKTINNFDNCKTVLAGLDILKHLKEYVRLKNHLLVRVLMTLLLNIVEFKELRKSFLKKQLIEIFHELLIDTNASIAYRALALFVFLMSEGANAWQSNELVLSERNKIIQDMDQIIEKWKSNKVKMTYSGSNLNSIIEMQSQNDSICQKWACWILSQAHFKPTDTQKEKAIQNLKQSLASSQTDKAIKNFAKIALKRIETLQI